MAVRSEVLGTRYVVGVAIPKLVACESVWDASRAHNTRLLSYVDTPKDLVQKCVYIYKCAEVCAGTLPT